MNTYETLADLDVSSFTEKKGQFTYLSWADAVNVLLKKFPEAQWTVNKSPDGWPYTQTPAGCFVEVSLTIEAVTRTQVHPVLDHRNQTVKEPNAFQVNTSIQRCLAKAISLHGLGLYIYRGEDLPENPKKVSPEPIREKVVQAAYEVFKDIVDADVDVMDCKRVQAGFARLTSDEQMALWGRFGSDKPEGCKKGYKAIIKELLKMKEDEFFDANTLSGDK